MTAYNDQAQDTHDQLQTQCRWWSRDLGSLAFVGYHLRGTCYAIEAILATNSAIGLYHLNLN